VSRASPGPLDQAALRSAVLVPGSIWSSLDVVAQTGSTNEDLLAAAQAGAAEGAVLAAEHQTRGRGRQGRTWTTAPGTALTFSVLLRPDGVPPAARGWLPLLAGVAVARAVTSATGVQVSLKWPNDVLAGGAKLAGILAEQAGSAVVIGTGINVGAGPDDLPGPRPPSAGPASSLPGPASPASAPAAASSRVPTSLVPTSLALRGAPATERGALLAAILHELEHWYRRWASPVRTASPVSSGCPPSPPGRPGDPDGSGLRGEYLRWCSTIGAAVVVQLPGGAELAGVAAGIDAAGCLVVATESGTTAVSAGDVIHLRRVPSAAQGDHGMP
jgi:BirA family transcriptional regulator, biotin operon repressor / biotin---[acetyl-CoA-carboxylase] ligase